MMTNLAKFCACVCALVAALSCSRSATMHDNGHGPIVVGTVVDAATGEPVSGARVEGPEKHSTRTDSDGRFELTGLPVGLEGDVTVELSDGRSGRIHLRPLRAGRLEVVLQLSKR
jgi:hypothetical protein